MTSNLSLVSLFSGIGGFEQGFHQEGFETVLTCEIEQNAQAVLKHRFPNVALESDVSLLPDLPKSTVIAAGFPCQNLSLVGNNTGLHGEHTKIVFDLFRLLANGPSPEWLVLENVPFMLWQKKGEAIAFVTNTLTELGYKWAYRVIDVRAFGLPQRRRRVIIIASKTHDPREVIFADEHLEPKWLYDDGKVPCGFSWTEGRLGLGWAPNCVPTIKGGSSVGVPSPPAIWFRESGNICTPAIEDTERLQGFKAGWTKVPSDLKARGNHRWKLVGNAVPVPLAKWIAGRIKNPLPVDLKLKTSKWADRIWPNAAYNIGDGIIKVDISEFPASRTCKGLGAFLHHEPKLLSTRAALGFLKRAKAGKLRFATGFLEAVESHAKNVNTDQNRIINIETPEAA